MVLAFQVCFVVGVALTLVFLVVGQFFDFMGIDGLDLDFAGTGFFLPLSPIVYILFFTVFGGMGLILLQLIPSVPLWVIALISIVVGIGIAALFYKGIIRPLKNAENTSAPNREELIGVGAKVTETIPEKGYGEIAYTINGNSYIAPAKSISEEKIKQGTAVAICNIEEYVFYVTRVPEDKFLAKNV